MRHVNLANLSQDLVANVFQNDPNTLALYKDLSAKQGTDHKTSLLAKKTFIFISDDCQTISIKELGVFGRIFRWLGFYSDSKFSPAQLTQIRTIFDQAVLQVEGAPDEDSDSDDDSDNSSITADSELQPYYKAMTQAKGNDGIKLLDKKIEEIEKKYRDAPTETDRKWIKILKSLKDTRQILIESLKSYELLQKIKEEDGLRSDYLDEILAIVKDNNTKKGRCLAGRDFWDDHFDDLKSVEAWTIATILKLLDIDIYATFDQIDPTDPKGFDCLGVKISADLEDDVNETLKTIKEMLGNITEKPKTWEEYLSQYDQVDQLDIEISKLKNKIQPDVARAMKANVRAALVEKNVPHYLVDAYLDDAQRGENRVFQHTNLFLDNHPLFVMTKAIIEKKQALRQQMLQKINKEYETKKNPGAGNCFFYSCADQLPEENKDNKKWREEIAKQLQDDKYVGLIHQRLLTDEMARRSRRVAGKDDHEKYCKWIKRNGNWGSAPELQAFSDLVQRPVIVVQTGGGRNFEWSASFNLTLDAEPLIFINHGATHYEAMVKKNNCHIGF